MEFKELWDLETAMQVLQNTTVDAGLWSEAVEWLLHFGPQEIRQVLLDASEIATITAFPDLEPSHYTADGQPCYDIAALARSLGITEEQTRDILRRKDPEKNSLQAENTAINATVH